MFTKHCDQTIPSVPEEIYDVETPYRTRTHDAVLTVRWFSGEAFKLFMYVFYDILHFLFFYFLEKWWSRGHIHLYLHVEYAWLHHQTFVRDSVQSFNYHQSQKLYWCRENWHYIHISTNSIISAIIKHVLCIYMYDVKVCLPSGHWCMTK